MSLKEEFMKIIKSILYLSINSFIKAVRLF